MKRISDTLKKVNLENAEKTLNLKIGKLTLSTLILFAAIIAYAAVFSHFMIIRNYQFSTYAWDLGIFNQSFWTTINKGTLFYSTVELIINPSGSFFGTHFSPILFLILPLYALSPNPQSLLIIQSVVLALAAIPLYKLSAEVTGYKFAGLFFAIIYLMYPALQGINWFDFHVESFLPLFFFSTMYFFETQQWKFYFLFTVLALCCEEHAAFIVAFIGIFGIVYYRKQSLLALKARDIKSKFFLVPFTTIILAVVWYLAVVQARSIFFPINPLFINAFKATSNWSILGIQDPTMIPLSIILSPAKAIQALNYDSLVKTSYILILFAPLAFKSFSKAIYTIPTIPWFVYSLFSNYPPYYRILDQYPSYVIAFIFVAAVFAIKDSTKPIKLRKNLLTILVFSLIVFILVSPLSPVVAMVYPQYGVVPTTQHENLIHEVLTYIPSNASVLTQNNLFPHVSSRMNAYVAPTIGPLWSTNPSACTNFTVQLMNKVDYILVDVRSDSFTSSLIFSLLHENPAFKLYVSADGTLLYRKDYLGPTLILAPYNIRYDSSSLTPYDAEVTTVSNSTSAAVLYFNSSSKPSPVSWYGPRTPLPSGEYNVTLRLKTNSTGNLFTVEICSNNGENLLLVKNVTANAAQKSTWFDYTLNINLDAPLSDFEVRALNVSSSGGIYLDYIDINQITS